MRQRDKMSPKLCTLVPEGTNKLIEWSDRGICILGECLSHLRFADAVVLPAETKDKLISEPEYVQGAYVRVGRYSQTTIYMTSGQEVQEIWENQVQRVEGYVSQTPRIG